MAKKANKTNIKNENKNKKSFFKNFKAELKKVVWPTPKQLVNNTTAVVVIVIVTALIVFCLDFAFKSANDLLVNKVDGLVESKNTTSTENTTSEESENTTESSGEENSSETVETTEEQNAE